MKPTPGEILTAFANLEITRECLEGGKSELMCERIATQEALCILQHAFGDQEEANREAAKGEDQPTADTLAYRRVSDIEAKPIRWLWPGRIARGKVTVLAGHPGLGKSQAAVSLAAVVTTGGIWPVDRTPCERGSVIILSAEDDPADTIRPRLEAAGADLNRCWIAGAVHEPSKDGDPVARSFNLAKDIERLGDLARRLGDVAFIDIDPITAYLGGIDSHKNADVRGLLAPLAAMAAERGVAILCVSHMTKAGGTEALLRVMGSLGFVAAARSAYLIAKDPDDEARRLFLPMKNNLAEDRGGLAFRVRGRDLGSGIVTSCVEWDGERVNMTADEALAPAGDPEDKSDLEVAKEFLRGLLANGPVPSKQIRADAAGACYAWRTIERAKKALGIEALKEGGRLGGGAQRWVWRLPETKKPAEDRPTQIHGGLGGLGGLQSTEDRHKHRRNTEEEERHIFVDAHLEHPTAPDTSDGNGADHQALDEIRAWLTWIGEDSETVAEVLEGCASDPDMLAGYLKSARAGLSRCSEED